MIYLLWICFALIVGFVGGKRKIGFGWAFFWSILLSPLIGLLIALSSSVKSTPKFLSLIELGSKAEFRKDFKQAYTYYMDALYHLENDYSNKKLSKFLKEVQEKHIRNVKERIESIKTHIT